MPNHLLRPHEERVVIEKRELDAKLAKLKAFCFGSAEDTKVFSGLDPIDRDLLESQYTAMKEYSMILGRRIERFQSQDAS
jgi:hypothetical protein